MRDRGVIVVGFGCMVPGSHGIDGKEQTESKNDINITRTIETPSLIISMGLDDSQAGSSSILKR